MEREDEFHLGNGYEAINKLARKLKQISRVDFFHFSSWIYHMINKKNV